MSAAASSGSLWRRIRKGRLLRLISVTQADDNEWDDDRDAYSLGGHQKLSSSEVNGSNKKMEEDRKSHGF